MKRSKAMETTGMKDTLLLYTFEIPTNEEGNVLWDGEILTEEEVLEVFRKQELVGLSFERVTSKFPKQRVKEFFEERRKVHLGVKIGETVHLFEGIIVLIGAEDDRILPRIENGVWFLMGS